MKQFVFIISIIVFLPANGFLAHFLRRLTPVNVIQGGINNGILGIFYYHFFYKSKQEEQRDVQKFIENTKPWNEAPKDLKRFNPHKFVAGNSPVKNPLSFRLFPGQDFYMIDSTLYISHKAVFDYQKNTDKDLYLDVLKEYERQSKLSAIQSESTQPFLEGIGQVIAAKKVGSKILYPTFRRWLRKNGIDFYWTYPKIAFWSVVDLYTKYFYGNRNFEHNRLHKYTQSCIDVELSLRKIKTQNEANNKKD